MASILRKIKLAVPAHIAWKTLRDVGKAETLFSPVLIDSSLDGDVRTVQFADGMTVKERIIVIDEENYRVAYTVLGDMFDYHAAAMQIVSVDETSSYFIWVSDFLPEAAQSVVEPLVEKGMLAVEEFFK